MNTALLLPLLLPLCRPFDFESVDPRAIKACMILGGCLDGRNCREDLNAMNAKCGCVWVLLSDAF